MKKITLTENQFKELVDKVDSEFSHYFNSSESDANSLRYVFLSGMSNKESVELHLDDAGYNELPLEVRKYVHHLIYKMTGTEMPKF